MGRVKHPFKTPAIGKQMPNAVKTDDSKNERTECPFSLLSRQQPPALPPQ